ncbi:hypothetical protein KY311_01750 [Candidatus Woesearchaeota archaeon]|nr:hypothetical protein [Candidatus Woesearchaeota archaeon]MBW3017060.1 hypothetical protein [Candidatus Woesearchaeota archaeon]
MSGDGILREEFDHFIDEFEATRDSLYDEFSKLKQEIELLKDELKEIKESILNQSQNLGQKRIR